MSTNILSTVVDRLPILEYIKYEQAELDKKYAVILVMSNGVMAIYQKNTAEKMAESLLEFVNHSILKGIADAESCCLDEITLVHDSSSDMHSSNSLSTRLALRVRDKVVPLSLSY